VCLDATFKQTGGDSLAAVQLVALAQQHCKRAPPVDMLLDPTVSLRQIGTWIDTASHREVSFADIHGPAPKTIHAAEVDLRRLIGVAAPLPTPRMGRANHTLLTGATGFLGRFLLLELLRDAAAHGGHVTCLVRAADDASARRRLGAAYAGDGSPLEGFAAQLTVHAGNFAEPRLGLAQATYERLAAGVDDVLHNGALVNHALSYEALFAPNVLGTAELLRFALHRHRKSVAFVSTTGVLNGLPGPLAEDVGIAEAMPERPLEGGYANGYCTSKWAGEILLAQCCRDYDIPTIIFRSGLILGHRQHLGQQNLPRPLAGAIAVGIAALEGPLRHGLGDAHVLR
ncbi:MAG: NAD-dependent epimerase/dehydratase family protein, partial [Deltaproteobacteria bacterium]